MQPRGFQLGDCPMMLLSEDTSDTLTPSPDFPSVEPILTTPVSFYQLETHTCPDCHGRYRYVSAALKCSSGRLYSHHAGTTCDCLDANGVPISKELLFDIQWLMTNA